ncbi:MAG: hypothetical protein ACRDH5_04990, partial [bacterium]
MRIDANPWRRHAVMGGDEFLELLVPALDGGTAPAWPHIEVFVPRPRGIELRRINKHELRAQPFRWLHRDRAPLVGDLVGAQQVGHPNGKALLFFLRLQRRPFVFRRGCRFSAGVGPRFSTAVGFISELEVVVVLVDLGHKGRQLLVLKLNT